jgi:hypothetical protein
MSSNPPLERSAAVYFTRGRACACAPAAAQRHYVMQRDSDRNMKECLLGYWSSLSTATRVSLVLFVAVCLIWLRSYWRSPFYDGFTTESGLNTFMADQWSVAWKHRTHREADYVTASGPSRGLFLFGIGAMRTPAMHANSLWTVEAPLWLLAAIAAIAPALGLRRYQRARLTAWRVQHRLCVRCGYDMRATPDRCPECAATQPLHDPTTQRTATAGSDAVE